MEKSIFRGRKNNRSISILLSLVLILSSFVAVFGGTKNMVKAAGPITILTAADLHAVRLDLTADYILGNNIDLDVAPYNGGDGWEPIGTSGNSFRGSIDGNGFTISNLMINRPTEEYVGLFGIVGNQAGIKNVSLIDVNVNGNKYVGGLAGGSYENSSIISSVVTGNVDGIGDYTGGLVGYHEGTIETSSATGKVNGTSYVGGLVGRVSQTGIISDSESSGAVEGTGNYIGGLVGYHNGEIESSLATGKVNGTSYVGGLVGQVSQTGTIADSESSGVVVGTGDNIGGLVGLHDGTIETSSSTGEVNGTSYVGGLVGRVTSDGIISDSESSGAVEGTGNYTGGLVGYHAGTIKSSLATGQVNGVSYVGGLVGDVTQTGTISDSESSGVVVGTGDNIGGLVGYHDGKIETSSSIGEVNGTSFVGGLVGQVSPTGTISDSESSGAVVGTGDNTGGLVGSHAGKIETSLATGSVNGEGDTGGLVGATSGHISKSFASGNVSGKVTGGLVGRQYQDGEIVDTYASGTVSSEIEAGGLVGRDQGGTIKNSYTVGNVTTTGDPLYAGGLVGIIDETDSIILDSFYDRLTTGQSDDDGRGLPKSTAEMKTEATFTNWDFTSIWGLPVGDYPRLQWEINAPKEITSVETLADITVAFGTDLIGVLPTQVEVTLNDNSTVDLVVSWDGGTPVYNGNAAGTYEFTGTFTLVPGVVNTDGRQAKVKVIVDPAPPVNKEIISVETLADITVDFGTDIVVVGLPTQVEVTLNDNSTVDLDVTWDGGTPVYDENAAGSYEFAGLLNLGANMINPNNISASIKVTVRPKQNNPSNPGGNVWVGSSDASLKQLELFDVNGDPMQLTPSFAKDVLQYEAETAAEQVELVVKATHTGARVMLKDEKIDDQKVLNLVIGKNEFVLTVKAEDGSTKNYKLSIHRTEEKQVEPTPPSVYLTDIDGHWAETIIKRAVAAGIVNGHPDHQFKPDKPTTRAEFTVMLANALKLNVAEINVSFMDDHLIGDWAKWAIAGMVREGIVFGYEDNTFRPNQFITRSEMMVMIARALQLTQHAEATGFADDADIPAWAKGAVEASREKGIVEGRGNNRFYPLEQATRAEALAVIIRMMEVK